MGSISRWTAVAVLAAVWVGPVWGQNPLAPAPKPAAENPLAKKPDSPFAGTYRGDGVMLQLKPDHTGTLTFNGKEYPVTGKADGTTFNGKFAVGQDQFDF